MGLADSGQRAGVGDGNIEASTHGLALNRKLLHISLDVVELLRLLDDGSRRPTQQPMVPIAVT